MSKLGYMPNDLLEIIFQDLEVYEMGCLWLSGDPLIQKRLRQLVRACKISARIWSPLIEWNWLNLPIFDDISSLQVDGGTLVTEIGEIPLKKLPRTLRRLEIKSPNVFAALIDLLPSDPALPWQTRSWPPLEHLSCHGSEFKRGVVQLLPTSLVSLEFQDDSFANFHILSLLHYLPTTLQTLSLRFSRIVVPTDMQMSLPKGLTDLTLERLGIRNDWTPILPSGLKRLCMVISSPHPPDWNWSALPAGLEAFEFRPHQVPICQLPRSITSLKCLTTKECVSVQNCKPSLKHLHYFQATSTESLQNLPNHLISLHCILESSDLLADSSIIWPNSLTYLKLVGEHEPLKQWPPNLSELVHCTMQPGFFEYLPKHITHLGFNSKLLNKEDVIAISKLPLRVLSFAASFTDDAPLSFLPSSITDLTFQEYLSSRLTKEWPSEIVHLSSNLKHFCFRTARDDPFEWSFFETIKNFDQLETLRVYSPTISAVPITKVGFPPHLRTLRLSIVDSVCSFDNMPESLTDLEIKTFRIIETAQEVVDSLPKFIRRFKFHSKLMKNFHISPHSVPPCLVTSDINLTSAPKPIRPIQNYQAPNEEMIEHDPEPRNPLSRLFAYLGSFWPKDKPNE
jgi:hypothetical protein